LWEIITLHDSSELDSSRTGLLKDQPFLATPSLLEIPNDEGGRADENDDERNQADKGDEGEVDQQVEEWASQQQLHVARSWRNSNNVDADSANFTPSLSGYSIDDIVAAKSLLDLWHHGDEHIF
jgi:hypothetical protein